MGESKSVSFFLRKLLEAKLSGAKLNVLTKVFIGCELVSVLDSAIEKSSCPWVPRVRNVVVLKA